MKFLRLLACHALLAAVAAQAQTLPPLVPAASPDSSDTAGMAFAAGWLPRPTQVREDELHALGFYLDKGADRAALPDGQAPGVICRLGIQDTPPASMKREKATVTWKDFKWLMPLKDATALLGNDYRQQRAFPIKKPVFPSGSLAVTVFKGPVLHRVKPGTEQLYDFIYFVTDKKLQLVSVQLVGGKTVLRPEPVLDPYYNFLDDKWDGTSAKRVHYRITAPGDVSIKSEGVFGLNTARIDGGNVEDVFWFLPTPFAKRILMIVDTYPKVSAKK